MESLQPWLAPSGLAVVGSALVWVARIAIGQRDRLHELEKVVLGDQRAGEDGLAVRTKRLEQSAESSAADLRVVIERIENALSAMTAAIASLESKIDWISSLRPLAAEEQAPSPKPLPRVATNPRIDVSKIRKP